MNEQQRNAVVAVTKRLNELYQAQVASSGADQETKLHMIREMNSFIHSNSIPSLYAVLVNGNNQWDKSVLRLIGSLLAYNNRNISKMDEQRVQAFKNFCTHISLNLLNLMRISEKMYDTYFDYVKGLMKISFIHVNIEQLEQPINSLNEEISTLFAENPEKALKKLNLLLVIPCGHNQQSMSLFIEILSQMITDENIQMITQMIKIARNDCCVEIASNGALRGIISSLLATFIETNLDEGNMELFDVLLDIIARYNSNTLNAAVSTVMRENLVPFFTRAMSSESESIFFSAMQIAAKYINEFTANDFMEIPEIFGFLIANLRIPENEVEDTAEKAFEDMFRISYFAGYCKHFSSNREAAISIICRLANQNLAGLVSIMEAPTEENVEEHMFMLMSISDYVKNEDNQEINEALSPLIGELLGLEIDQSSVFIQASQMLLAASYSYMMEDPSDVISRVMEAIQSEDDFNMLIGAYAILNASLNGVNIATDDFLVPKIQENIGNYSFTGLLITALEFLIINKGLTNPEATFEYIMTITNEYVDEAIEKAAQQSSESESESKGEGEGETDSRGKSNVMDTLSYFIENYPDNVNLPAVHQMLSRLFEDNDFEDDSKTETSEKILRQILLKYPQETANEFTDLFFAQVNSEAKTFAITTLNKLLFQKGDALASTEANDEIIGIIDAAIAELDDDDEEVYDICILVALMIQLERIPPEKIPEIVEALNENFEDEEPEDGFIDTRVIFYIGYSLIAASLICKDIDPGDLVSFIPKAIESVYKIQPFATQLIDVALIHAIQQGNEDFQQLKQALNEREPTENLLSGDVSCVYIDLEFPIVTQFKQENPE